MTQLKYNRFLILSFGGLPRATSLLILCMAAPAAETHPEPHLEEAWAIQAARYAEVYEMLLQSTRSPKGLPLTRSRAPLPSCPTLPIKITYWELEKILNLLFNHEFICSSSLDDLVDFWGFLPSFISVFSCLLLDQLSNDTDNNKGTIYFLSPHSPSCSLNGIPCTPQTFCLHSLLTLFRNDDDIYKHFREEFPNLNIENVDDDSLKSPEEKERWHKFTAKFGTHKSLSPWRLLASPTWYDPEIIILINWPQISLTFLFPWLKWSRS